MADHTSFQRLFDDLLGRSAELARQLVAHTQAALRAASTDIALAPDRNLLFQVSEAVQTHRLKLENALATQMHAAIHAAWQDAPPGKRLDAISLDQLTLVDEAQAEHEIEVSRTVQLIELTAEWEWRELQAFIATLRGDTSLRPHGNPFRPAIYARALSASVHELALPAGERALLLRVSGRALAELLRNLFAQVCERLRQQGQRPLAYQAVNPPRRPRNSNVNVTQPGALQSLLERLPSKPAAASQPLPAALPATAGSQALSFHALAQSETLSTTANASHPAFTSAPGTTSNTQTPTFTQEQVLTLLGKLFAQMRADDALQPAIQQLIGQLQPAVLRIASHDPQILRTDRHPAWRLINQVAAYASGYSDPEGAELTDFVNFIGPRIADLAPPPGPSAAQLQHTLDDVQAFIERQSQAQLQTAPQALAQLQEADQKLAVRPILLQQVEQQLAATRIKPGIKDFLLGPWVDVLCHAMASGGPDDDTAQAMMATVDDLIHSLQRPTSLAEREALRQSLPGLISRLKQGMASIAMPEPDQDAILKALMGIHGHHLLAAPKPAQPKPEPSAAELVAQMREELASKAQASRQSRRSQVVDTNIGSLPTVPMPFGDAGTDTPEGSTPADWAASLQKGMWCKLFLQGQWMTAHLLWISANRQFYMFTSDQAGRMHSLTHRALVRLRTEGLATSLEERSLMQRAVDSVLQDLGD